MRAEEVAVAFGLAARPRSSRSLGLGLSSGGVQEYFAFSFARRASVRVCGCAVAACRGSPRRAGQNREARATERSANRILENGGPPKPRGTRVKRRFRTTTACPWAGCSILSGGSAHEFIVRI